MKIIRSLTLLATSFCACSTFAATLVDLTQEDFKRPKSSAYQLKALNETVDKAGNKHIRYEQTYQDLPVYGYHVIEHVYQRTVKAQGLSLKSFSGTSVQGIERDLPAVSSLTAVEPATTLERLKQDYAHQHHLSATDLIFENELARAVIFIDDNEEARVAHEVNFFVDFSEGGMPSRPHYLVDAQTGKMLKQWEGLTSERVGQGPGGNQRIGYYNYGQDKPALDISKSRRNCSLSGEGGKTVNAKNGMRQTTTAYAYNCRRSMIQDYDASNGAASPLNDAHYFIDVLTQFYRQSYDTAPLPFPLVMRAHYGRNFANAFWNGNSMTYGDGNDALYPFVVLDIAAHEIAHGVTENHSKLTYEKQSGGMNEAFSDMASRAVDYFVYGSNDWYLGGDIFKDPNILALRFMDNPSQDGKSIDHVSQYTDALDVHHTSGVYNKAFYLLATTGGWNTLSAFDVMYYANVAYWEPNTTYASGAWGVVQAAAAHGQNVDDVINAFEQVGIQCDKVAGKCV
jgi:pseudolysin/vibriolysin